jgi:hypothetical protein
MSNRVGLNGRIEADDLGLIAIGCTSRIQAHSHIESVQALRVFRSKIKLDLVLILPQTPV